MKSKAWDLCWILLFFKCAFEKTGVFFVVWSNYINTENSYGCLIDFLSQISKLLFQSA